MFVINYINFVLILLTESEESSIFKITRFQSFKFELIYFIFSRQYHVHIFISNDFIYLLYQILDIIVNVVGCIVV